MLFAVDEGFGGKVKTAKFTIWGQNAGAALCCMSLRPVLTSTKSRRKLRGLFGRTILNWTGRRSRMHAGGPGVAGIAGCNGNTRDQVPAN